MRSATRVHVRAAAAAAAAAGAFLLAATAPATTWAAGTTERVSVGPGGVQGDTGAVEPSISADGRFVAFGSWSTNLVPGDTNGWFDIFVRDRRAATTERVSVSTGGVQGDFMSVTAAISADGRFVAFGSGAGNLVAGDTNGRYDAFVRDRLSGTTERVSVSSAGVQGDGNSASGGGFSEVAISAGGRFVAFASDAANLLAGDTNGLLDVFVRDRRTGRTGRASVGAAGVQGNSASYSPAISADGRFVAFTSDAANLVAGDINGQADVFVRDRLAGRTERVSVGAAGLQGDGRSRNPAISADGRYVAFVSEADDLVPGDSNAAQDVFVRDRLAGTTARVSVSTAGSQGSSRGGSGAPSLSPGGRFVAFQSLATNLVPGDTNGKSDVFVRDRVAGTTVRVSVGAGGVQANGRSAAPAVSADGRFVAFHSRAFNLVPGDTNGATDVFVRNR